MDDSRRPTRLSGRVVRVGHMLERVEMALRHDASENRLGARLLREVWGVRMVNGTLALTVFCGPERDVRCVVGEDDYTFLGGRRTRTRLGCSSSGITS